MVTTCDVAVIGGGLAGLIATAALRAEGLTVICVEPSPPPASLQDKQADLRSTAVLMPGVGLLQGAGLWTGLASSATALATMQLVALDGSGAVATEAAFTAEEVGQPVFGYNLPNWQFRYSLASALPPNAIWFGRRLKAFWPREVGARLLLDDDSLIEARLVLGADGRHSALRDALGIGVKRTTYGQSALVFSVAHPRRAHGFTSTEFHSEGGPLTFVPLPDQEGDPASAIVWMTSARQAEDLAAMDEAAFLTALDQRSAGWYGPLRLLSRRGCWPIISQRAERLTGPSAALMAEAAHVVPPIGAQGLNMSLADIACLLELIREDRAGLGQRAWLNRYAQARLPDIRLRMTGIDLLNRVAQAGRPELRAMRAQMLRLMHGTGPIRRGLMQAGLGLTDLGQWLPPLPSRS